MLCAQRLDINRDVEAVGRRFCRCRTRTDLIDFLLLAGEGEGEPEREGLTPQLLGVQELSQTGSDVVEQLSPQIHRTKNQGLNLQGPELLTVTDI